MKLLSIRLPVLTDDVRINYRSSYLAKIGGSWFAGKFSKQWYGWNFNAVYDAGYQVDYDGWEKLYHIKER